MSRLIAEKKDAKSYGLQQKQIPRKCWAPVYGQMMIASEQSHGGLMMIDESKGKKIIGISGGSKKLFIFEEQNQSENVLTALHPENEDFLSYNGEEMLPIDEVVLALEGNKLKQIRSGKEHNIIMTEEGTLYSVGKGNFGSLGLGGTIFAPSPRLINKLSNKKIISIACGMYHTLALSNIGDVFSWGRGFEGQLGLLESVESTSSPHFIPHFFKYNSDKDIKILQKTPIIEIACGSYHSIAIDNENNVYCWGQAMYGQTGNGKKSKEKVPVKVPIEVDGEYKKVVKIDGGFGHTMCLTDEGQIFSWGLNIKGQLGLNDLPENIRSDTEGHLNYVKAAYHPVQVKESRDKSALPKFTEIACGFTSSFAIDEQGHAWAWGGGCMGFKDKYLERGPVMITEMTDNKKFTKVFANDNSMILFCPLSPLYFKPSLVPSRGLTEITFFGNGFMNSGQQTVRFTCESDQIEVELNFDEKTNTYYCQTPIFEKINKKYNYPVSCKVEISLDKKEYFAFEKNLLIYSSKLQIQSIQPNCGSVLGGSFVKLYMPIPEAVLDSVENITVGFKNTNVSQDKNKERDSEPRTQNSQDWVCMEGLYDNETITCKNPNIPHFNHEHPFYMLDVSLNGQDFTQIPHTFRYYFITDTKIEPCQGMDDDEPECKIQGMGLFDTPAKELKITLDFHFKENDYNCSRNVELKWNKAEKGFQFKMPKLSWIIGDHEITPELLEEARKQPCVLHLMLAKKESVEIGRYVFVVPPPPPEPEEEKKDAKKGKK